MSQPKHKGTRVKRKVARFLKEAGPYLFPAGSNKARRIPTCGNRWAGWGTWRPPSPAWGGSRWR